MGMTSAAVFIRNKDKCTRSQLIKRLCGYMKADGLVKTDEEGAEISVTLAFSKKKGVKWFALRNADFTGDEQLLRDEAKKYANIFDTDTVSALLIDSDFIILSHYDAEGKLVGSGALGTPYGKDEAENDTAFWTDLIGGHTEEELNAAIHYESAFAEDILAETGKLADMDVSLLYCDESDDRLVNLYFGRAAGKAGKPTIGSIFVDTYRKVLEPAGFRLIKTKYPYFARLVNGEILQYISYMKQPSDLIENAARLTNFVIVGGFSTVYCTDISLHKLPKIDRMNEEKVEAADLYYCRDIIYNDKGNEYREQLCKNQHCNDNDPESIRNAMDASVTSTKDEILRVLDGITDIDKCLICFLKYFRNHLPNYTGLPGKPEEIPDSWQYLQSSENLLYFLADAEKVLNEYTEYQIRSDTQSGLFKKERLPDVLNTHREVCKKAISIVEGARNDPVIYKQITDEMSRRKASNIAVLKKYGLFGTTSVPLKPNFSKAFDDVYGELLSPFGFKRVKSGVFARCINNEIVHVITYEKIDFMPIIDGYLRRDCGCYKILGGAATVYKDHFGFGKDNIYMRSLAEFYIYSYASELDTKYLQFVYKADDAAVMREDIGRSFEAVKKVLLPEFDAAKTLDGCMDHFFKFNYPLWLSYDIGSTDTGNFSEGLLKIKLYDAEEYLKHEEEFYRLRIEQDLYFDMPKDICDARLKEYEASAEKRKADIQAMYDDTEWINKVHTEFERRKERNIAILKKYGLFTE